MLDKIRSFGIKYQMLFWMSLISVVSFTVLFGINYGYYSADLLMSHWRKLQAVAEQSALSTIFYEVDDAITKGENADPPLLRLSQFVSNTVEKFGLDGISVYYRDGDSLVQILQGGGAGVKLEVDPEDMTLVESGVEEAFYTRNPSKVSIIVNTDRFYYYIQPVVYNLNHKYAVCVFQSSVIMERTLMRYFVVNVLSFLFVLFVLNLLVIYAANKVLICPILDIEKTVDSFVYQVSGGYLTFYLNASSGNELTQLKKSVNRLEKLVGAHNKQMEESDRYSSWLRDNVDRLDAERFRLDFKLKSAQFDSLCDKQTFTGNSFAWEKKCEEMNHRIQHNSVRPFQMVYIRLSDGMDVEEFIKGLLEALEIHKGIPMETVFRVNLYEFVFIFKSDKMFPVLEKYVEGEPVSVSHLDYEKGAFSSLPEMLDKCKELAGSE